MEIDKEDSIKINFILNRLANGKGRTDVHDLHNNGVYPEMMDDDDMLIDFERILRIISKHNLAEVIFESGNYCALQNENTHEAYKKGVNKYLKELNNKNKPISITNNTVNVYKSRFEQINQDSDLKNILHKRKEITNPPTPKPTIKNPIFSKLIEYWWQLLIAVVSGIILILIERGIIDIGI